MNPSSGKTAAVAPGPKSLSSRIPSIVFALAVSACAVYAAANGPAPWAAAQHLTGEQIRQEARTFCTHFRMPPGSESFPTCVAHLSEVRRLHENRVTAEAAGVF